MNKQKLIIESPFKNENPAIYIKNVIYINAVARNLMLNHNVAPLYFHTLYTQNLNDNIKKERDTGLYSSFEYHTDVEGKLVTIDRGISTGVILGINDSLKKNLPIRFYTAMPDKTPVGEAVAEINKIEDPEERVKTAIEHVDFLKVANEKIWLESGSLTDYERVLNKEIKAVKHIILNFFDPILSSIKQELEQEKKKESDSELSR